MAVLLLEFDKKVQEINQYFRLVKFLDDKQHIEQFRITSELQATLKANCYLLIYNLVESSIVEGLDAIFEDINQNNVSFEDLNNDYKKMWLKYKFQLINTKKPEEKFNISSSDILDGLAIFKILNYRDNTNTVYENYKGYLKVLETNSEVSGNLDARQIRVIAEKYGFFVPEKCDELLEVKNFRNQLAHGERTFSEIGREKTVNELIKIYKKIFFYLRKILKSINGFIINKNYLKQPI